MHLEVQYPALAISEGCELTEVQANNFGLGQARHISLGERPQNVGTTCPSGRLAYAEYLQIQPGNLRSLITQYHGNI